MGIRYYAYPVAPNDIDDAKRNPDRYLGADPLMDAWGGTEPRPRMLYLDKCWSCLQGEFGIGTANERPAAELVRGEVRFVDLGWFGFRRVLDAAEVAAIANDLELVLTEVDATWIDCPFDGATDYVRSYLTAARYFTQTLAERGEGLVYLIG
ncbi:hypothetical protein [Agromyces neolithicus]|uniref:DUF1877 family protein n=1 Tax=Agromyces neolithicus TaxID=269420 RepID=A0ABP4YEP9_9MICO